MPAVIDSMMYVGATPWHKEGVKLDSPPNCQEALVASGLNWEVVKRPTYYSDPTNDEELFNGFGSKPTGHYVTMRTDTGQVLGNVSQKYEVLQNSEAFMPFEALLDHGYELETAGAIELGRKVWILAKAPDSHMVGDEQVDPYILCYTSHDGSSGNNIRPTMIRVVCKNTLDLSLSKTADYQYNLRHTSNIKQNVKDLTKNIRKCEGKMKEAVGVMNEMNEIELNEEELALYFEAVIPFLKHRHKESIP